MTKIKVYTKERGLRTLKPEITFEQYREKYPAAIVVKKVPCEKTLAKWFHDGGCKTIDGCWVEPDGSCEHGFPSWLKVLHYI